MPLQLAQLFFQKYLNHDVTNVCWVFDRKSENQESPHTSLEAY